MLDIADARNQFAVTARKPVSEDASPKFSAADSADEAITFYRYYRGVPVKFDVTPSLNFKAQYTRAL